MKYSYKSYVYKKKLNILSTVILGQFYRALVTVQFKNAVVTPLTFTVFVYHLDGFNVAVAAT